MLYVGCVYIVGEGYGAKRFKKNALKYNHVAELIE